MKYVLILMSLASAPQVCAQMQTIFGYAQERQALTQEEQLNGMLVKSIQAGNVGAVGVALSLGADCKACDKAGNSACYYVQILSQKHPKQASAIKRLLDEQAS